jgi:hypothetical protein
MAFDMASFTVAQIKASRKAARQERERLRGRMRRQRFDRLAGELARVIKLAFAAGDTGSLFGMEGPLRAGIRSDLCLAGWTWETADSMARDLLAEAFRRARAVRPSWYEGQPEWVIRPGVLIERTRCVECGKPLEPTQRKFCSTICNGRHHRRIAEMKDGAEDVVVKVATRNLT